MNCDKVLFNEVNFYSKFRLRFVIFLSLDRQLSKDAAPSLPMLLLSNLVNPYISRVAPTWGTPCPTVP